MLTGSGLFAHLSRDFEQTFRQIASIRIKNLSHTNLVASRYFKEKNSSLPVEVRCSKTLLLELPINSTRTQSREATHLSIREI